MKTKKTFDCVEMKNEAQRRRAKTLRCLSPAERLEFYRREHAALARRQQQLRSGGTP